jgi:hypothetical protein
MHRCSRVNYRMSFGGLLVLRVSSIKGEGMSMSFDGLITCPPSFVSIKGSPGHVYMKIMNVVVRVQ